MFCIFVYATGNEQRFEASVPLRRYGEFMLSRGYENRLNIFFMKGLSGLSPEYREQLEALGYRILDKEAEATQLAAKYPNIASMSTYYANMFLRWLLPWYLLERGELSLPVIVVDGDIVFNAPFSDIEQDVLGKTFLLQGNPCFTAVSSVDWFRSYARELDRFERDPEGVNAAAQAVRSRPVRSDRAFCNASVYPTPIRHDQDFLQYLVGADLLPQDTTAEIFKSSFYWAQNALFPGQWFEEQVPAEVPRRLTERGGELFVGTKKLAFVHFQNDFAWYAHCAYRLDQTGLGILTPLLANEKETGHLRLPARILGQVLKRLDPGTRGYGRDVVYAEVLARNPRTGNAYVADIINRCW